MIAIITGDISDSRAYTDQEVWMGPLKKLFALWGKSPQRWEIFRGDSFQVKIDDASTALNAALHIKACVKSSAPKSVNTRVSLLDVRLSIGIGEETHSAKKVTESNGTAYQRSGENFENLYTLGVSLALKTEWPDFDREMNLYLKLAGIIMDKWSISSAEFMQVMLKNPELRQVEMGKKLGIGQNSVSKRYTTSQAGTILEVDQMFREKLKTHLKTL
ncbi:MAG: hypothetical protein GC181_08460 [Bacteroidetes bacterium]|nr:hypothetical protein [Bacteroidota bacterium]